MHQNWASLKKVIVSFVSSVPAALVAIPAAIGSAEFSRRVYQEPWNIAIGLGIESCYIGLILFARNKGFRAYLTTALTALICGVIYNTLHAAEMEGLLGSVGWQWEWVLAFVHGSPLSILGFSYFMLLHSSSDARENSQQIADAQLERQTLSTVSVGALTEKAAATADRVGSPAAKPTTAAVVSAEETAKTAVGQPEQQTGTAASATLEINGMTETARTAEPAAESGRDWGALAGSPNRVDLLPAAAMSLTGVKTAERMQDPAAKTSYQPIPVGSSIGVLEGLVDSASSGTAEVNSGLPVLSDRKAEIFKLSRQFRDKKIKAEEYYNEMERLLS